MFDGLIDTVKGWLQSLVEYWIWRIFYWLEIILLKLMAIIEGVMKIFTGEEMVKYDGEDVYLINVFFEHRAVRGIYGGIAMIGIIFAFAFAIVAVIRKILDLRDKQQGVTMGSILGNLLKSILIICSMNLIMLVAIETSNTLIRAVAYAINHGEGLAQGPETITFNDQQYATMGRIINTIGNYSLNPSYKSRYNLNACYNDIRPDLRTLGDQGVFNYHYVTTDTDGKTITTWQSLMEKLARAYDYDEDAPLDSYDDGLTSAMLDAMEILQENPTLPVLKTYTRTETKSDKGEDIPMDRILFLVGTMGMGDNHAAARNQKYNEDPSFFDNVRLPFYLGEDGASIYSYDDVRRVFDPSPFETNYVLVYFSALAILKEMLVLIVTCAVRIFNLLALYVAAPLAIATMPMDDGAKFKQWTTAFIVQLLTIVGMVIAMKLFLMFIPIIWSPALETSSNPLINVVIKMVIQYGAVLSVNKVNGIFTGILADNAGLQAVTAGDVRSNIENSSAGKMLGSMSAGSLADKAFGKGRQALGKGIGKVSSTAAYISDAMGITEGAYEGSEKRQKDDAKKQEAKGRQNQRQQKALAANIDSLEKTGRNLDGSMPKSPKDRQNRIDLQKKTLAHMQNGESLKDATAHAKRDMKEDKLDQKQQAEIEAMKLRTPPPKRQWDNDIKPNKPLKDLEAPKFNPVPDNPPPRSSSGGGSGSGAGSGSGPDIGGGDDGDDGGILDQVNQANQVGTDGTQVPTEAPIDNQQAPQTNNAADGNENITGNDDTLRVNNQNNQVGTDPIGAGSTGTDTNTLNSTAFGGGNNTSTVGGGVNNSGTVDGGASTNSTTTTSGIGVGAGATTNTTTTGMGTGSVGTGTTTTTGGIGAGSAGTNAGGSSFINATNQNNQVGGNPLESSGTTNTLNSTAFGGGAATNTTTTTSGTGAGMATNTTTSVGGMGAGSTTTTTSGVGVGAGTVGAGATTNTTTTGMGTGSVGTGTTTTTSGVGAGSVGTGTTTTTSGIGAGSAGTSTGGSSFINATNQNVQVGENPLGTSSINTTNSNPSGVGTIGTDSTATNTLNSASFGGGDSNPAVGGVTTNTTLGGGIATDTTSTAGMGTASVGVGTTTTTSSLGAGSVGAGSTTTSAGGAGMGTSSMNSGTNMGGSSYINATNQRSQVGAQPNQQPTMTVPDMDMSQPNPQVQPQSFQDMMSQDDFIQSLMTDPLGTREKFRSQMAADLESSVNKPKLTPEEKENKQLFTEAYFDYKLNRGHDYQGDMRKATKNYTLEQMNAYDKQKVQEIYQQKLQQRKSKSVNNKKKK